jgi:hypothetical protein
MINDTSLFHFFILASTLILVFIIAYYIVNVFQKNKKVLFSKKSNKKKIRMMYNLLLRTGDIRNISMILILLAFFSALSLRIISKTIYEETPEYLLPLIGAISSFIVGLSGYIQYFRQEMPWKMNIEKGWIAKVSGIATVFFFWGISIIMLIYGFILWVTQ